MKRAVLLMFLLTLLTSCACLDERKLLKEFERPMENESVILTIKEKEFKGTLSKNEKGDIKLSLISQNIKTPLEISCAGEGYLLSSQNFNLKASNKSSPALIIYEAFQKLPMGDIKISPKEAEITISPYKACFDKKTLRLKEILFPQGVLKFSLSA